jgi:hypothetical protein
VRKATLASILRKSRPGVRLNEMAGDDQALDEDGSCGRSGGETDSGGFRHCD